MDLFENCGWVAEGKTLMASEFFHPLLFFSFYFTHQQPGILEMETLAIQSPLVHGCRKEAPEKAIPYPGATAELPPERVGQALPPLEHCRVASWLFHLWERVGSSFRSGF